MERKHCISILGFVLALVVILPAAAQAALYGFEAITNNSGISNTVAGQLSVDVTDPGSNQVLFTFYNAGPVPPWTDDPDIPSTITTIYFDDTADVLSGLPTIFDAPAAVDFAPGATPGNLPSGNTANPAFVAMPELSAQNTSPLTTGVNVGESVALLYNIVIGKTFTDVITALNLGLQNIDALRIGLHVQGIDPTGVNASDSFITPVPGAVLLGILGLGIAGWKLRRFA